MDLRRSGHMKLMKPCAAMLAAFVLVLGLMLMPRMSSAAGNDDVEMLHPPVVWAGDPDTGGQGRFGLSSTTQVWAIRLQTYLAMRFVSSGPSRSQSTLLLRDPSSKRPTR